MEKINASLISLSALTGKKRYFMLFLLGMTVTFSLAPFYIFPILFISFTGLFGLLSYCKTSKQAFITGWWFGFGYYVTSIYWMAFSLLTEADKFWWMVPFAVFGLSAMLAVYIAVASLISHRSNSSPLGKVIIFATVWVIGELARSYFITFVTLYGFPWNLLGYSWLFSLGMAQMAAYIGTFSLSLLTIIICATPLFILTCKKEHRKRYAAILLIIPLCWAVGTYRLHYNKTEPFDDITLRLVQANLEEHHRWDPRKMVDVVRTNMQLSQTTPSDTITHIIWSESSLPYILDNNSPWLPIISRVIPEGGTLLTGAMRIHYTSETKADLYSTLQAINHNGKIEATYDKYRLVPFGEYIPWRSFLPINSIVGGTDFSAGGGAQTLTPPNTPSFSPLICYDVIFPQSATNQTKRPQWMVNITNDAWFEKRLQIGSLALQFSTGPYQHFSMAHMRAIEQGISLVRVANTGISANIDPYGRIIDYIPLGVTGFIDTKLYTPINNSTTYRNYGDIITLIFIFIINLLLFISNKKYSNIKEELA